MAGKTIDELFDEEANAPPTVDELFDAESKSDSYRPYAGESRAGNLAFQELTFGLGPRILAAAETGAVSGPDYEKARDERFARNDAYSYDNPGTATAASLAGALPTAFIPGFGAARVGRAALQGANAATNLNRGQRALRALGVGREIGGVGHEAGMLGAKYAGVYGGLSSREETPEGRLADAAKSIPLGYAFGRGAQAVLGPMVGASEYVDTARRIGGSADMGARTALRRATQRDGTSIDSIRQQVLPNMGDRRSAQDAVEAAVMQYNPTNAVGSVQGMRAAYIQGLRNAGVNIQETTANDHVAHIRRLLDSDQGNIPLNLPEVARRAGSRAQNLSWTQRVAGATPGESRERLFDAVTTRQEGIIPKFRDFVDRRIGNADLEDTLDDLITSNRARERALYDSAEGAQIPFDLRPLAEGKARAVAPTFARTKDREIYEEALGIIGNNGQPHTLQSFINANSALNDMIGDSMVEKLGREVSTSVTAPLMELKKEAQALVAQANPNWRVANDATAGGRSVERMLEDVAKNLNINGRGPKARRLIKRVSTVRNEIRRLSAVENRGELTPFQANQLGILRDQDNASRIGFARVMHDVLDGLGDTHDVSKYFLKGGAGASSGVRNTMRQMMGDQDYREFMDMVQRGQMSSTTFKNQFNSQTNPLEATRAELDAEGRVAGFARILGMVGSPSKMLEEASLMAARRFNEGRNRRLADYYTQMTDEPAGFLRMLRDLEANDVATSPVFGREGVNAYSAPAAVGGAFSSQPIQNEQRYRQKYGY